jgi:hypothetical protein
MNWFLRLESYDESTPMAQLLAWLAEGVDIRQIEIASEPTALFTTP